MPEGFGDHTIFRSASGLLQSQISADSQKIQSEEGLRKYAERLNLVNEVHRALGQSMELEELLELIWRGSSIICGPSRERST